MLKMVELQLLHEVGKLIQSVSTSMVLESGMLSGHFFVLGYLLTPDLLEISDMSLQPASQ